MKSEINVKLGYRKTVLWLTAFSIAFGGLLAYFGEVFLPFSVATLAALAFFENNSKKTLTIISATLTILFNAIITVFAGGYNIVLGIEAVVLAVVMYISCLKKFSKPGMVLAMTAIATVFLVASLVLLPIISEKSLSIEVVNSFYSQLELDLKKYTVDTLTSLSMQTQDGVTSLFDTEGAEAVFNSMKQLILSVGIVFAFAIVGLSCKIFSAILRRCLAEPQQLEKWRFTTSSLYAYFFVVLSIVSVFIDSYDDVLPAAIMNLYNVFTFVYAYLGLNVAFEYLRARRSKLFAVTVLLIGCLMFSSAAIQILSVFGVFHTLYNNKIKTITNGGSE